MGLWVFLDDWLQRSLITQACPTPPSSHPLLSHRIGFEDKDPVMIAGAVACGRKEVATTDGVWGMTSWIAENEIVIMTGRQGGG